MKICYYVHMLHIINVCAHEDASVYTIIIAKWLAV